MDKDVTIANATVSFYFNIVLSFVYFYFSYNIARTELTGGMIELTNFLKNYLFHSHIVMLLYGYIYSYHGIDIIVVITNKI